ncbi:MAG: hypothetical protein Q9162_003070 [Coniocarpon cinnabarinum]
MSVAVSHSQTHNPYAASTVSSRPFNTHGPSAYNPNPLQSTNIDPLLPPDNSPSATPAANSAPFYHPASSLANPTSSSSSVAGPVNLTPTATAFLGNVTSVTSNIVRDLGWRGQLGDTSLYSYGDSLWCSDSDEITCNIFASNTVAMGTSDPCQVKDFATSGTLLLTHPSDHYPPFQSSLLLCPKNRMGLDLCEEADDFSVGVNNLPPQFCPFEASYGETPVADWGMGISNIISVSDTESVCLFWLNHRPVIPGVPAGSEAQNHYVGGGIAKIDTPDNPTCHRQQAQYWNATNGEPLWGDHGFFDGQDGYLYALGGASGSETNVYLARVPKASATDATTFQYWHGNSESFTAERLTSPTLADAMLTDTNAGSLFYWTQKKQWISLSRSATDLKGLTVRSAPAVTGPWSDETKIYDGGEGAFIYGPVFHPEFQDPAKGGTDWFISFTGLPNIQQMIRLDFA